MRKIVLFSIVAIIGLLTAWILFAQVTNPPTVYFEIKPGHTGMSFDRPLRFAEDYTREDFWLPTDSMFQHSNLLWRFPQTSIRLSSTGSNVHYWVKYRVGYALMTPGSVDQSDSVSVANFVTIDSFLVSAAGVVLQEMSDSLLYSHPHAQFIFVSDTLNTTVTRLIARTLRDRY